MNIYDIVYGTSITQIGKALSAGQITEKRLRSIYNERRRTARRRLATVSSEAVKAEFGNQPDEYFQRSENLVTSSQLIHALVDVNRFMSSQQSTIGGLRHQKEKYIERAQEHGIPIDESNYTSWIQFIRWFKSSAYSLLYDSDSEEVAEAFSEGLNPEQWEQAFKRYREIDNERRANNRREKR